MKKVFLLALAAIAAGAASATITEQHVYGGSLFGDAIQTRLDAGYVNPYLTPLTPANNQVTLTLTNTPSGWKHTAWLSHAGSSTSADRIAAHYTETDFVNPLPYEWHSQTDQNAWRAIVARFDPIKVTFKFDVNDGSETMPDVEATHSTNKVSIAEYTGTRQGYGLRGWVTDSGKLVYTKTITFNYLGGSTTNLLTRCFASSTGEARQMSGKLPLGFELGNADTNIWLHASWTGHVWQVAFDVNHDKIPAYNSGTVTYGSSYGETLTFPANPTRVGYLFRGWSSSKGAFVEVTPETIVSLDRKHNLYAHWTDRPVVTFNYRNASGKLVSEEQYVDYGGSATAPTEATVNQWPGHVFTNWDRSFANVTESIAVNAQYSANVYTIVFDANGSAVSGTMADQTFTCGVSQALRSNKYARQGYSYGGWNTAADGTGTHYSDAESVSDLTFEDGGTVTLYAQWSPISYTIEFAGGAGASGSMSAISGVEYDEEVTLPANAFAKNGCAFLGWTCGSETFADGATVSNLTTTAGATVTMTAVWDAPYYVAYDANGGEGEMAVQRFEQGEAKALSSNEFSRAGYAFSGWATNAAEAAALNVRYADGQVVVDIGEVAETNTLYAVWSTNVYWVAFDPNGGEGDAMPAQRFVYDQPQNLTSNAYSKGELWRFDGWSNTVNGVVYADGESVGNLCTEADATNTLVAVWASNLTDLSRAMHCDNLQWNGVVMSPLGGGNLWTAREGEGLGYGGSGSCAEQTGAAGNALLASVTTNGTISFWCRNTSSTEALLDMTINRRADVLIEDGQPLVPVATLSANSEWQQIVVGIEQREYSGSGELYIKFTVRTSGGTVQIDQMTWKPEGGANPEPTEADRVEPSAVAVSDGGVSISFTGDSTFAYHLQATDSLSPTNWYDFGATNVGADALQSFEIPIDADHPQRFFKIEVIRKDE